jgi:hypothetical protein
MKARKHVQMAVSVMVGVVAGAGGVRLPSAEASSPHPAPRHAARTWTAQDAPPVVADTLDAALAAVTWDVSRRGPLLIVNPQGTHALPSSEPLPASERAGDINLRTLAARFGRQMMPVRSLTALIPTTMVVLNARPGRPDPYAGLQRNQKVKLLMASLTPAQWRALGSAQGLGMGDLSQEQQPLFLSLLPEPFALDNYKMQNGDKLSQHDKNVVLTPQQRSSVHLRVNRAVEMYLPRGNGNFEFPPDLQYYALPDGTEFFTLAHVNPSSPASAFGVTLRTEVPNRLKPGALAFDAPMLNVPVSLTGAKTVGDLVQRIAHATSRELYADGRVSSLPVWVRGASSRAGDVLQALCLAVTGTFRQVGPALVLTSDLEGIGTRYAQLADWAQDADAQRQTTMEAADKAAALRPEQYIGFAPDYPFAFSASALQKLTSNGPEKGFSDQYDVPLASLPPRQQAVIQAYFASRQKNIEGDRVKVSLTNNFSYVVPGIGGVNEEDVSYGSIGLPAPPAPSLVLPDTKVALPADFATRALFVQPANGREASLFVEAARRHGLNQLWVEVEESAAGQKLLKEAVTAGKENHLEVVAVLRLMQTAGKGAQSDALPQEIRDRNLLDETGSVHALRLLASPAGQQNSELQRRFARRSDWLRPESPATRTYLQQRLREIASTSGLSGMALVDAAPPGYLDRGIRLDPFAYSNSNDFGYTPALRLAYLRHSGYDPIDLIGGQYLYLNADLSLPFFPAQTAAFRVNEDTGQLEAQGSRTALQDWDAYRYKVNADLLVSLRGFLQANFPAMPVLLRQAPNVEGWWSGWDKPEGLPEVVPMAQESNGTQAAQMSARPLLLNIAYTGSVSPKTVPTSARHFASWVKHRLEQRPDGWNGMVIDLSALPANQALDVLEGLSTQPAK